MNRVELESWLRNEIIEMEKWKPSILAGIPEIFEKGRRLEMLKFALEIVEKIKE